jgi:mannose-6-phosphate isomerase-like protein (cupin superfamily)
MRSRTAVLVGAIFAFQAIAFAQGQAAAQQAGRGRGQPPAPGPGSPAIYKSGAELDAALKAAIARGGTTGMSTGNVTSTDQWQINLIRRDRGANPITHAGNTEVHHIVDGAATFVTGGKVIKSASGTDVEGGVTRRVGKGDVILIPADTVHWYKDVEGSITYLEIRFVVPTK